jgi:hypothetical protein
MPRTWQLSSRQEILLELSERPIEGRRKTRKRGKERMRDNGLSRATYYYECPSLWTITTFLHSPPVNFNFHLPSKLVPRFFSAIPFLQ